MNTGISMNGGSDDIFQTETRRDNLPDLRHKSSEPTHLKQHGAKQAISPLSESNNNNNNNNNNNKLFSDTVNTIFVSKCI